MIIYLLFCLSLVSEAIPQEIRNKLIASASNSNSLMIDYDITETHFLEFKNGMKKQVRLKYDVSLGLKDSDSAKVSLRGESYDVESDQKFNVHTVFNLQKGIRRSYFARNAIFDLPSAHYKMDSINNIVDYAHILPLFMCYSLVNPRFAFVDLNIATFHPEELAVKTSNVSYYFTDRSSCLPSRIDRFGAKNELLSKTEFYYLERLPGILSGWKHSLIWNSVVTREYKAEVKFLTLGSCDESRLTEDDLPPGTWVSDYISGKNYAYRGKGDLREILPGEFNGGNFQEILNSETPGKGWRTKHYLGLSVILIVLLISGYMVKGKKRRMK